MIIDLLFLMIFLTMGVFGMRKGFIESLTDFLNLAVGISIALFYYVDLSFFISKYLSFNPAIIIFFSISIIFVISLIILRLLTSLLLFLFDGSISSYKKLNIVFPDKITIPGIKLSQLRYGAVSYTHLTLPTKA